MDSEGADTVLNFSNNIIEELKKYQYLTTVTLNRGGAYSVTENGDYMIMPDYGRAISMSLNSVVVSEDNIYYLGDTAGDQSIAILDNLKVGDSISLYYAGGGDTSYAKVYKK